MERQFAGILLIIGGFCILLAIGLRWEWFIQHGRVRAVFEALGDEGATAVYIISGLILIIIGILVFSGI